MPKKESSRKRKAAPKQKSATKRSRVLAGSEIFGAKITGSKKRLIDLNVIAKYDRGGMPYLTFTKAADKLEAVKARVGQTLTLEEFIKQSG